MLFVVFFRLIYFLLNKVNFAKYRNHWVVRKMDDDFQCGIFNLFMNEEDAVTDEHSQECNESSNDPSSSPIFKLNIDCFHKIFERLSFSDLLSIGKTCKSLQKVAGDFYRMKYVWKKVNAKYNGLFFSYHSLNIFSNYITKVIIPQQSLNAYRYIGLNCKSLKEIRLCDKLYIPNGGIECIKNVLKNIHVVYFNCTIYEEFYETFLKHCPRLKMLSVCFRYNPTNVGSDDSWLLRKYPTLRHLEITQCCCIERIYLQTFFGQNPNVQTFSIDSYTLFNNRNIFLALNVKLDKLLSIQFSPADIENNFILFYLLNKLYDRDFYKRLHVYCSDYFESYQHLLDRIILSPWSKSIKMLYGKLNRIDSMLEYLTTLGISDGDDIIHMEEMPRKLPNLERIQFWDATTDHIFPFIRGSPKLEEVKIGRLSDGSHYTRGFFNLAVFNEERKRLNSVRKVIIYVSENHVVGHIWSNHRISYEFVELQRIEWSEWKELNSAYRYLSLAEY